MQNSLNSESFMRVHRKFIVQLDSVKMISDHTVILENDTEVQVSRTMEAELVDRVQRTG
jgi:DNA-binding LytR/AlgR family response regulator